MSLSKRTALITFILVALVMIFTASNVHAKPVQMHKKDTHTVIVGNSRVVGLWNSRYRGYSLIGSSGGQYTTNDGRTIQSRHYGADQVTKVPLNKSRFTTIRNSIKAALKKHHKCRVVIFSTINECRTDRVESEDVEDIDEYFDDAGYSIVDFARKCRIRMKVRTTAEEKKKAEKAGQKLGKFMIVRARVYIVECPKSAKFELGLSYKHKYVKKYNKAIRENIEDEPYMEYVKLKREPKDSEFSEDGLHFKRGKTGYNKLIWKTIKSLDFV